MSVPSSSQVKKAGSTLRKFMRHELHDVDRAMAAIDTMEEWRRAHYIPLVTANNGLRSRARTVGVTAEITQRLKRSQTIFDKLRREPSLDLSRMQDIGGCRAVVANIDDLRKLERQVMNGRLKIVNHSDYIERPRVSGYRGVHIVVVYQGRNIEIQLRTEAMHRWALAVEDYAGMIGENIKQDGDHPIQLFLATASDIMALQEQGEPVPAELLQVHEDRRVIAQQFLQGGAQ